MSWRSAAEKEFPIRFPQFIRPDNTIRDLIFYSIEVSKIIVEFYGICAVAGPEPGEIRVKKSNDFAQHVKIVSSFETSFIGTIYTCRPASF